MGTMFGWSSCASTRASRRNRSVSSASACSARMIFTATSRARLSCRARCTAPMPPVPMTSKTSCPGSPAPPSATTGGGITRSGDTSLVDAPTTHFAHSPVPGASSSKAPQSSQVAVRGNMGGGSLAQTPCRAHPNSQSVCPRNTRKGAKDETDGSEFPRPFACFAGQNRIPIQPLTNNSPQSSFPHEHNSQEHFHYPTHISGHHPTGASVPRTHSSTRCQIACDGDA